MSEDIKGVFVRIPLSEDRAHTFLKESNAAWDECNGSSDALACTSGILAIGTPVTGDELRCEAVLQYLTESRSLRVVSWNVKPFPDKSEVQVTPLADAIAKLAEKDAEIARLWSALDEIEMGIDALPDDNEDYSKMSAREMRRQALEVVKAEVKALKGGAA